MRAAYLAMEVTAWVVIVPLSLAAPLTGLVMSLGTRWGLLRHYWVLAKILTTIPACILLLLHMQPIGHLARVVAETTLARGDLAGMRIQLVATAGAAMVRLLAATTLSVYKPWGRTGFGRREHEQGDGGEGISRSLIMSTPRRVYVFWIIFFVLVLLFVILHLAGGGLGHHTVR